MADGQKHNVDIATQHTKTDKRKKGLDSLGDIDELFEQEQIKEGYETGYTLGAKAGEEDGFSQGSIEGAKRGSEVGFYKGYSMTWAEFLKAQLTLNETHEMQQETKRINRVLCKLNEILELVDSFPMRNETFCEDKLSNLRVKFKQATMLLNVKVDSIA